MTVPLFYKEKKCLNIKLEFKTLDSLASGFSTTPPKPSFHKLLWWLPKSMPTALSECPGPYWEVSIVHRLVLQSHLVISSSHYLAEISSFRKKENISFREEESLWTVMLPGTLTRAGVFDALVSILADQVIGLGMIKLPNFLDLRLHL